MLGKIFVQNPILILHKKFGFATLNPKRYGTYGAAWTLTYFFLFQLDVGKIFVQNPILILHKKKMDSQP